MTLMRSLLLAAAPLLPFACPTPSATAAVEDATSIVARSDGGFDVTCRDGTHEVDSSDDIMLGKVCGGGAPTGLGAVVSITRRPDGDYDVVCRDGQKEVDSADVLRSGQVCTSRPAFPTYFDDVTRLRWQWSIIEVNRAQANDYCRRLGPTWRLPDFIEAKMLATKWPRVKDAYTGQISPEVWTSGGSTNYACIFDFEDASTQNSPICMYDPDTNYFHSPCVRPL